MKKITEAQIFLTRECNLKCGYCNIVRDDMNELGFEEWKKAYDNMENIGIKTVKVMGGEPTVKKWLPGLLEYISKGSIRTAILSNSLFDDQTMERLVDAGLWGYFASVDGLSDILGGIKTFGEDAAEKSSEGYKMLHKLKERGVPLLAANVVINKPNMHEVPEVAQRLSNDGFYVNLCTVQHTKNRKEFSRTNVSDDYRFTEEGSEHLEELANKLIQKKRSGVKITVPETYIRDIPVYGINCDWKCEDISQLRIDADGSLMLCNEYRTPLADKYNITSITLENYERFLRDWKESRDIIDCDGCYWSCFLQAEDNIRNGLEEFHYFKNKERVYDM